jgi:hypothetical protein
MYIPCKEYCLDMLIFMKTFEKKFIQSSIKLSLYFLWIDCRKKKRSQSKKLLCISKPRFPIKKKGAKKKIKNVRLYSKFTFLMRKMQNRVMSYSRMRKCDHKPISGFAWWWTLIALFWLTIIRELLNMPILD